MTCDCQKEIQIGKETILEKMEQKFEKNSRCHDDMKKRINQLNIELVELKAVMIPIKNILWYILTAVLVAIVGAVMSLIIIK